MFDTFRSKHPPSDTVKRRKGQRYAIGTGVADECDVAGFSVKSGPAGYFHSMVPGGLLVMSSTTRLTSATSLVMRVEMRSSTS